jgi:hypothetical protein
MQQQLKVNIQSEQPLNQKKKISGYLSGHLFIINFLLCIQTAAILKRQIIELQHHSLLTLT